MLTRQGRAAAVVLAFVFASPAVAQPAADIVVTPTRTPQPIQRAGSAVTVITGEEIARDSIRSVGEILRRVPGLTATQAGGPGQTETVRLRGAESRHTLVLIDGIRVNDPASTGREFDFANLVPSDIERIEVLRGPQSALYGSDAMGGVINIITRRGGPTPRASVSVEGGSYGTREVRGNVSGASGPVDYSFGIAGLETQGFSAFGYRIRRLRPPTPWGFEPDPARRFGATGRLGFALADGVRLEIGGSTNWNRAHYDAGFGTFPDTPSVATGHLHNVYARLLAESFGGVLRNTVTVFHNRTERLLDDVTFGRGGVFCIDRFVLAPDIGRCRAHYDFHGERTGAEYQGDLNMGPVGLLTFGARVEQERANGGSREIVPTLRQRTEDFRAGQTTRSVFALHQITVAERTHLSIGGRVDDVTDVARFATWRATLAHEIFETDTKLRASAGTGGKAPSIYQVYGPYGTRTLEPEHAFGVDAGIDQRLFGGLARLSGTVFLNRFRNLIDFTFDAGRCGPTQFFGCYFNVAKAESVGFELSADVDLVPGFLRLRGAYTNLRATDRETRLALARRPEHEGRIGLAITPVPDLTIEPRVVFVGERFDRPEEVGKLAPYARLDVYADYRLTPNFSLFARAVNLTDTRYEEVLNYGTAGRSFSVGARATW
jgi:vitamin B12 transporter